MFHGYIYISFIKNSWGIQLLKNYMYIQVWELEAYSKTDFFFFQIKLLEDCSKIFSFSYFPLLHSGSYPIASLSIFSMDVGPLGKENPPKSRRLWYHLSGRSLNWLRGCKCLPCQGPFWLLYHLITPIKVVNFCWISGILALCLGLSER